MCSLARIATTKRGKKEQKGDEGEKDTRRSCVGINMSGDLRIGLTNARLPR